MSAPATQNGTPNGTNSQQSAGKGRGGNSRSNTPDANRGANTEGDANYKQNQRYPSNPEYKKKYHQKNAEPAANGQGGQGQGQGQGQGGQDRRKGKDRASGEQGGNDPNLATANGDKKFEKRHDDRRRRRDKEYPQQQEQPATPQPAQPAQPQPPVSRPVDPRVEESRRISSLISNPTIEHLSEQQHAAINEVSRVLEGVSEADIYAALKEKNWDQNQTIISLTTAEPNSWSEVVKKREKPPVQTQPLPQPHHQPQADRRQNQSERSARPLRGDRQQRANGQASHNERQQAQQQPPQPSQPQPQAQPQQQPQPHQHPHQQQLQHQQQQQQLQQQQQQQLQHQQQQHQYQLQQQQQHQYQLQQMAQHQYQQQQQQQLQVYSPANGEEVIMQMSKVIGSQLEEIAKKSKLLLEMQSELESIHTAGKDQLNMLHSERTQLISEKDRLNAELSAVEDRLVQVDIAIGKAEQEKLHKLTQWQIKSTTHGLMGTVEQAPSFV